MLERVHALVDEVLLRREVVEDRLLGDIGGPGDLGDADLLEATLQKGATAASAIARRVCCFFRSRRPSSVFMRLRIAEACCDTKHWYARKIE